MKHIKKEIIDYIKKNRISTTEVADALGKKGVLNGVMALCSDQFKVGKVRNVFTANNSNYALHEQLRAIEIGDIVCVHTYNCDDRAVLGDLIAKFSLLYKQAEAIVVNGLVRDGSRLKRERYSIWAKGITPLGCFNTVAERFPLDIENEIRDRTDDGIVVCDDGGVVIIPNTWVKSEMMDRLARIEMQEDIWYFCLNTLKWDTKKIVCDKAYLKESDLLSTVQLSQLEELMKPLDENE
jgi:regulator of RNase E activity RraA